MGSIRGRYEWDNDDLTPGQKREGGLHQNLFDSGGHLKGSARFIPDNDGTSWDVTDNVFIPTHERQEDDLEFSLKAQLALVAATLVFEGIKKGTPVAKDWWINKARPALAAHRPALPRRKKREIEPETPLETADQPEQDEPAQAVQRPRRRMSMGEAQARYIAAAAAQALADEQRRLISEADILGVSSSTDLGTSLSWMTQEQLRGLLESMVTDPELLRDASLAGLASLLGPRAITVEQADDE